MGGLGGTQPLTPLAAIIPAMKPLQLSWRVVLVRPRNPLNIGAAARAMANFGLLEMSVVAPFEPTWEEARTAAMGGDKVIESARALSSLRDALSDVSLVIGTTTGARRNLGREPMPLPDLGLWLRRRRARGTAVLLFGSEKTGLSNDDLSHCHALVRIPTTANCPSMNLGQAVAVCAYDLARTGIIAVRPPSVTTHISDRANLQTLDHLFDRTTRLLDESGYFQPKSRAAMLIKLRRFLLDLNLTCNDARILGGVLSQVNWKLTQTRKSE